MGLLAQRTLMCKLKNTWIIFIRRILRGKTALGLTNKQNNIKIGFIWTAFK